MLVGLGCALGAALLYGAAAVGQAVASRRLPPAEDGFVRLTLAALRDRLMLVVIASYLVGAALHLAAIELTPLYLAQAGIAASLPVTALVAARVRSASGSPGWTGPRSSPPASGSRCSRSLPATPAAGTTKRRSWSASTSAWRWSARSASPPTGRTGPGAAPRWGCWPVWRTPAPRLPLAPSAPTTVRAHRGPGRRALRVRRARLLAVLVRDAARRGDRRHRAADPRRDGGAGRGRDRAARRHGPGRVVAAADRGTGAGHGRRRVALGVRGPRRGARGHRRRPPEPAGWMAA